MLLLPHKGFQRLWNLVTIQITQRDTALMSKVWSPLCRREEHERRGHRKARQLRRLIVTYQTCHIIWVQCCCIPWWELGIEDFAVSTRRSASPESLYKMAKSTKGDPAIKNWIFKYLTPWLDLEVWQRWIRISFKFLDIACLQAAILTKVNYKTIIAH